MGFGGGPTVKYSFCYSLLRLPLILVISSSIRFNCKKSRSSSGKLYRKKAVELSEDEKAVLELLKANSPIELVTLKAQTGLSNKKWDKARKGLTRKKVAKVEKTGDDLIVELV